MSDVLPRLVIRPRKATDRVHRAGHEFGPSLVHFWQWSASDLVSNATRGVLAEFLVAVALGVPLDGVRDEWAAFDLTTPEGITVEVKSAAYVQSWAQRRLSDIVFRTPRTRAWDPDSNLQATEQQRQAQVYVFALLAHTDKGSIEPLDVAQWHFFVLPTETLNRRTRSQHSITLPSLRALAGDGVSFEALREQVLAAAGRHV
jgi:hypothetical protein